jgi:frataxin
MSHHLIALKTLDLLCEKLEEQGLDVDQAGESATIVSDSGIYLLNYHGTMDQIWMSSPKTGAHHFCWDGNVWMSTRAPISLEDLIAQEL